MLKKITKAINEFDPINLLPYAPPDEYESEISEIASFLEGNKNCDMNVLANKIYDVFERTFGEDVFNKSINDCCHVASEILKG